MSGRGAPTGAPATAVPMLADAGLLVGAWALLPPYTGPALNTAARVEFADHVVPGVVVVAISTVALVLARRPGADQFLFAAGLAVVLAGFWMTATHCPSCSRPHGRRHRGGPRCTTAFPAWPCSSSA